MTITTTTHLNFRGTARAALQFYHSVFGGTLAVTRYSDVGMPAGAPGAQNVVFGQLESDSGFRVMAYDIPGASEGTTDAAHAGHTRRANGVTLTDQPFFLSARGDTIDEVQQYWAALAEGAAVIEPLAASAWSPGFGMLTDRFGVTWILDVAATRGGR
ncbi:VOC family protein [Microbacterium sp. Sa4CUA7]|uniref:VOC family protein n=1 Tax=Microbacterium pullorum TaxID=2762236 RepID=A0ABR8RYT7_9MICO|nr:VOC family protein [Microbacterium pullorum]MBD7956407.1 VOC family protein [Microbacterium pullorum]